MISRSTIFSSPSTATSHQPAHKGSSVNAIDSAQPAPTSDLHLCPSACTRLGRAEAVSDSAAAEVLFDAAPAGKGKERIGKERKGKERKGKERKGKERKGKEAKHWSHPLPC